MSDSIFMFLVLSMPSLDGAEFFGIGDLPGGAFNSVATGVAFDGSLAAASSLIDNNIRLGAYWDRVLGLVSIDQLPGDVDTSCEAVSVIGNRLIVNTAQTDYTFDVAQGYVAIPNGGGISVVEPKDISGSGTLVVGLAGGAPPSAGYRYEFGIGTSNIVPPSGWKPVGQASAISQDGSIVVGFGTNAISRAEAYRKFDDFPIESLGSVPSADPNSYAEEVNSDGSVVVGHANGPQAFRWTEGTGMQPLGFRLWCFSVSGDGEVMVRMERDLLTDEYFAVLWIQGVKQDLRSYLIALGAPSVFPKLYRATDVNADGTIIVGFGENADGRQEGFWCRIPRALGPHSIRVNIQKPAFGSVTGGDRRSTFTSDDQRLELTNGVVPSNSLSPVTWEIEGTAARLTPSKLEFKLEAQVSRSGLSQTIDLWNHQTQSWQTVDTRAATMTDQTVTLERTTDATQFVRPQDGKVKARVRYKATAPGASSTWKARIDHARWTAHP